MQSLTKQNNPFQEIPCVIGKCSCGADVIETIPGFLKEGFVFVCGDCRDAVKHLREVLNNAVQIKSADAETCAVGERGESPGGNYETLVRRNPEHEEVAGA